MQKHYANTLDLLTANEKKKSKKPFTPCSEVTIGSQFQVYSATLYYKQRLKTLNVSIMRKDRRVCQRYLL